MIWLETRTKGEAAARRTATWGPKVTEEEIDGEAAIVSRSRGEGLVEGEEFWADAIKKVRDDPHQRLAMAKRHLPLPAAFREAAIALRSIIRDHRKGNAPFDKELRELHRLAAINSVADYDDLDATPFATVAALDLSPKSIGWEQLRLLNQSDRKLMAAAWDEPSRHTTGRALFPEIAMAASKIRDRERKAWLDDAMRQFDAIPERPAPAPIPLRKKSFLSRFFGW